MILAVYHNPQAELKTEGVGTSDHTWSPKLPANWNEEELE